LEILFYPQVKIKLVAAFSDNFQKAGELDVDLGGYPVDFRLRVGDWSNLNPKTELGWERF